jgi:nitrite reductase (NADH) large subunit
LILANPAKNIDKTTKVVKTAIGKEIRYDKLLIATGANAFVPPIPGADKMGVFSLRRIKDGLAIKEFCQNGPKNVLIIGGGVLGLEIGFALKRSGNSITIVEALPRLLPRQMDPDGAEVLKRQLESLGVKFYIGVKTQEITGSEHVNGVVLDSGDNIECDFIIISAGIRGDLTLANQLGLSVDRGLVVSDDLRTDDPDIFGAGDGVIHNGRLYGIWPASETQGKIAGKNMTGGAEEYNGTTPSNILKVAGIDLVSIGDIDAENNHESIVKKDSQNYIYKKLVIKDSMIIGAILYGDKKDWLKIKRAIDNKLDIKEIKTDLINWELSKL